MQSGPVWRQYSDYLIASANTFFSDQALTRGTAMPALPHDGGHLALGASQSLGLGAQVLTAAGAGGATAAVGPFYCPPDQRVYIDLSFYRDMEQQLGAPGGYGKKETDRFAQRASMSYVTGSHNFKVGFNRTHGFLNQRTYNFQPFQYRFNNRVANQITMYATPYTAESHLNNDLGLFAQDRWTMNRFTLNLALRFDYFGSSFPEQHLGPGELVPTRDITFPAKDNLGWKDLTYRTGLTYDLRGDGKTALKFAFNKYLLGQTLNTLGKQIAMHVAAAHPLALSAEDLPADLIERERAIAQGRDPDQVEIPRRTWPNRGRDRLDGSSPPE